MTGFVEYCADKIMDDATKRQATSELVRIFREEKDDQLVERICRVIEGIALSYTVKTSVPMVLNFGADSMMVVDELKKRLAQAS